MGARPRKGANPLVIPRWIRPALEVISTHPLWPCAADRYLIFHRRGHFEPTNIGSGVFDLSVAGAQQQALGPRSPDCAFHDEGTVRLQPTTGLGWDQGAKDSRIDLQALAACRRRKCPCCFPFEPDPSICGAHQTQRSIRNNNPVALPYQIPRHQEPRLSVFTKGFNLTLGAITELGHDPLQLRFLGPARARRRQTRQ